MIGYIHSEETFGTVDGPGIRYVLFMQGCPFRCLYCHNPDTWQTNTGSAKSVDEIITNFNKNKAFYSNGGITVSGGEPLVQIEFVTELFRRAKSEGIHTCIDTSGATFNPENPEELKKIDQLLENTDLVMLDIKQINPDKHKDLTGKSNENVLAFAKYLVSKKVPVWIRHVIVPSFTDNEEDLFELGKFIGKLHNIKALDVIPYHTMGAYKYKDLGIAYRLENVPPATKEMALEAKKVILKGFTRARNQAKHSL